MRQSGDKTPVIFLTSREDKDSLKRGFELGAVDYLRKPIDLDELIIRIRANLQKNYQQKSSKELGIYTMDSSLRDLLLGDKPLHIGSKVYTLLELFLEHSNSIVRLEEIRDRLWHYDEESSDGAIRVYITRLKKLFPEAIENIRGVGYRFDISCISVEKK